MHSLAQDYPAVLLRNEETPCLSLYQSTHRQHPDNVQDPIRFRNLVKELEESLRQKYPKREVGPLLQPFHALADNAAFWNHTADGLAVLGAPGMFRVYQLQRPVAELVVVADSFHTKPLMRITQSVDQFQILGLSRDSFKLFEGNRDSLMEVHLADGAVGHVGNRDTEQFFRAVDQAVAQRQTRSGGMGVILAALVVSMVVRCSNTLEGTSTPPRRAVMPWRFCSWPYSARAPDTARFMTGICGIGGHGAPHE